jgi:two-component system response regulator HydG
MRVEDLHHDELLELDPEGGVIRFAGQRALVLDAVAMGILRQYLVENFGLVAARAVLTQFGFAHGWRMAEAMQKEFKWASNDEWRRAGPRLYTLEGLFRTQAGSEDPLTPKGAMVLASYEAEQHLLHFGRSDSAVCWTICGLMSGYFSRTNGKEVYVLEDRCLGEGHAACHLLGRTREEWGDERAEELTFFDSGRLKECLDVSLSRVTESLKAAEEKLRAHRQVWSAWRTTWRSRWGSSPKAQRCSRWWTWHDAWPRSMQQCSSLVRAVREKREIARLVHDESTRAAGPFIAVNCGAITETLLESELFGHKRGAFTGASSDRPGLFEAANHGTLLLDEVGEISSGMQVKLLRVLQEREIRRVGENKSRPVDVRVLATTNRHLAHGVADGAFRQDLYYRLKVVEFDVPPLRDRREDILPLARVLLADAATRMGRKISGLAPGAVDQLLRYEWPGNVRELENAMERAVALARGSRVDLKDLPEEVRQASPKPVVNADAVQPLNEIEKEYILAVLKLNGGNQTRTAEQLDIGSATLYRKLKSYGLTRTRRAEK